MNTKLFFFLMTIVFFSCSTQKVEKEKTELISLIETDTISLQLPNNVKYNEQFGIYPYKGTECLGTNLIRKNRYLIFDKTTGNILKDIKIEKEGLNGVGTIQNLYFHNEDSIFLTRIHTNKIYLLNRNAKIINSWAISDAKNIHFDNKISSSHVATPLNYTNSKIYCTKIIDALPGTKLDLNDNNLIIFNTEDSTVNNNIFSYPEIYKQDIKYSKDSYGFSYLVNNSENIIVSFYLNPNIYVYSEDSLINSYNIESKYVEEFAPTPGKNLLEASWEENINYEIQKGSYKWMKYDKTRDYIIRLVLHKSELYDEEGNKNGLFDKEFSLQIINNKLELIGEQKFTANTFDVWNIIPCEEGLLISINNNKNPNLEEDKVKFVLYKYSNE